MPTGTFDLSGTPEKDLRRARCLLFIIYVGLGGFFVYTLYQLFVVGRVEVTSTMYKVDSLEAPSIVVCPFWPGTSIRPLRDQPVELWFYSVQGPVRMNTTPKTCRFDRVCICLDLEGRLQFTERKQAETGMIGTMGDKLNLTSDRQMEFKERLELRAWVQDPSPDSTLKIGFYDSVDSTPVWSYTREKSQMIGNLELVEWMVSSISFNNLIATIFDKRNRMQERRHIYKYNAQSVGAIKDDAALPLEVASSAFAEEAFMEANATRRAEYTGSTVVSYKMQSFFIEQIQSSETAVSPYSILIILLLLAARTPIVDALVAGIFPLVNHKVSMLWKEHTDRKPEDARLDHDIRGMAPAVRTFMDWCCCDCLRRPEHSGRGDGRGVGDEREPLLA